MKLTLNPIPDQYKVSYATLLKNAWLVQKVVWAKRISESENYIKKYLPQIIKGNLKVLDIGTGPGEFMEVARYYKCAAVGIISPDAFHESTDPAIIAKTMAYNLYSKIHHARQGLNVYQIDYYQEIFKETPSDSMGAFDIVNCRHAINLIFRDHFKKDKWIIDDSLSTAWVKMLRLFRFLLAPGGQVMIAALQSENKARFSEFISEKCEKNNFELLVSEKNLNYKLGRL